MKKSIYIIVSIAILGLIIMILASNKKTAEEKVYLWCDIDEPAMFPGMVTDIHNLGIARYAIITDESVELRAIKYDAQPIIDFIDSVPGIDANYINLIKRGCHQPSDN